MNPVNMTPEAFRAFDHAFNILDLMKATSMMLKSENIETARAVVDLLPVDQQPMMRRVLGGIAMGAIPNVALCDEAISALRALRPDMHK